MVNKKQDKDKERKRKMKMRRIFGCSADRNIIQIISTFRRQPVWTGKPRGNKPNNTNAADKLKR